jgi:hypothetical protein
MAESESKKATVYNKPGVGVRKMEATRFLAAFLLLIIMFMGIYLFTKNMKAITALGFPIAAIVAVGFFYWVKSMGDKADKFSRRAVHARRGAVAEEEAGTLLSALPSGYFVVHDFVTTRENIDHIVVSTKGILTIETKSHKGVVTFDGEKLRRDGQIFEKDIINQAWRQAFSIRDLLTRHGTGAPKPQPVILFVNADVRVREKVKGVEIISRWYLPTYLERLQNRMTTKEAEKIFELLKLSQARTFV